MSLKYCDLHLHSTLRPFAQYCVNPKSRKSNIWYQKKTKPNPTGRAKDYTQCDFTSLTEGNVKIAFTAMYPLEQGWFDVLGSIGVKDENAFTRLMTNLVNGTVERQNSAKDELKNILPNNNIKDSFLEKIILLLGNFITELPINRIQQIISKNYNYYEELIKELNYLYLQCKEKQDGYNVKIPSNVTDFNRYLTQPQTLIIIPTIEGAASLINGNATDIQNGNISVKKIIENIDYLKQNFDVFFITLSHHFYNGLFGHSQSIYGAGRSAIDQMYGKGNIITENGWKIIRKLLSLEEYSNDERRILIDTKHLSIPARIDFYNFIEKYNNENPDKKIPIISSHSAFSGQKNIENIGIVGKKFSNFEVNIAIKEVETIYKSGGLIGLNFDQNVLIANPPNDEASDVTWANLFVENIMAMITSIVSDNELYNSNIWDIFCLGSDFDGFIDPVNSYPTSIDLPKLERNLIQALRTNLTFISKKISLSPKEIIDKFMSKNVINFTRKNYFKSSNLIAK